nr:hypothetical protein [Tanacetum cinerariifolium]
MLHISPRIPSQSFAELPSEEEILEFFRYLRHTHEIRYLTDVNVNKLYQPWRSFASVINKCLTGKSSGIDNFRLSQAQILWGLYHRRNVDFAYLIWEDFVYQVEHKNQKRRNKMYYPRFTKVIIDYFMTRKPSIPRRNRINWHYIRDDVLFTTIKMVSRHQTTQQYEATPKPKASARKKKGDSASSTTPPTPTPTTTVVSALRLSATAKDEGTSSRPGVSDVPSDDLEEELSWNSFDDEDVGGQDEGDKNDESDDESDDGSADGNDNDIDETVNAGSDKDNDDNDEEEEIAKDDDEDTESGKGGNEVSESEGESDKEETRQEEEGSFDPIPKTPEGSEDEGSNEEERELRLSEEARIQEMEEANELYHDVNINQGRGLQVTQNIEDSQVTLTPVHPDGLQESSSMSSFMTIKNQVKEQVSRILPRIEESVNATLEAKVLTRSSHSSRTSYAIIADLSEMELKKILIEKMEGNKSIQRSDEQRNLYKALVEAYDADKAILDTYGESTILKRRREDDDQEGPSAGSDRGSKRRREGGEHASASNPSETATGSAGRSTTGSQSRQLSASESAFAEEPVQTTCQMEEPSHLPRRPPSPDRDWNKTLPAAQGDTQSWISDLARQTDAHSSFNELLDTPIDFSNFIMNWLNVDTLTLHFWLLDWVNPEGQQYPHNLLKPLPLIPDNRGRRVILFEHFINNDLEYLRGGTSSRKYTTSITKTKAEDYGHIKWIEDLVPRAMWLQQPIDYNRHALWGVSHWGWKCKQFYGYAVNQESALDVYSKRRIIAVTELKIVEWYDYKHLDWISVRRDDDQIYKFKEGDLKRLRLQDIEDMLLLLVQGKLSNLTVEERFAFNVSLRMFTKSIVIQRRVEDLQLGVESYQKRLNL